MNSSYGSVDKSVLAGMEPQEVYDYLTEILQGVVYVMDSTNTMAIIENILDNDITDVLNALNNPTEMYDLILQTKLSMGL